VARSRGIAEIVKILEPELRSLSDDLVLVPLLGSVQNDGAVWKLPDSEMSKLLATACSVSPTSCALPRSTSTLN